MTLFAGTGISGFSDGPALSAQFDFIYAMTSDSGGNVFFGDNTRLRRIDWSTRIVSTVAGSRNNYGYSNGNGTAAQFRSLGGLTMLNGSIWAAYSSLMRHIGVNNFIHQQLRFY